MSNTLRVMYFLCILTAGLSFYWAGEPNVNEAFFTLMGNVLWGMAILLLVEFGLDK